MAPRRLDLNKCTSSELCSSVPGITTELADRIIAKRRRKQRFKSIDEVSQVRGVTKNILMMLRKHVKVSGSSKKASQVDSSPRTVLVVMKDSEEWVTPKSKKRTTAKRKTSPKPKSASKTTSKTSSIGKTKAKIVKSSAKRRFTSNQYREKPSSGSPAKRRSGSATRASTRRAQKRTGETKLPRPLKCTGEEMLKSEARAKLRWKPPSGRRPVAGKSIPRFSPKPKPKAKSKPAKPRSAKKRKTLVLKSGRGKSTVLGGSPGETQTATAQLENCYVAVHSTPKGKMSPVVTVDINPTSPDTGTLPRSRSPQLQLSPIRSPKDNCIPKSGVPDTGLVSTSAKADISPLSVSESLDELLASSREKTRDKEGHRSGGSSQASERVSQWLQESSRYNLSGRSTPPNPNDTTKLCNYPLQQEYSPSPEHPATCKRALESDFEEASPVGQVDIKRRKREEDTCTCGVCRKCGKKKTPRSGRRQVDSLQDMTVSPALTWCNLV